VRTEPVTLLHRLFQRLLQRLFMLALVCWLAGCGPGVGGSGTGENAQALADFGATAAPVCAASFASNLKCTPATPASPGSGGVPTPSPDGTALVVFNDASGQAQISATLQDNAIELEARCARLRFTGQWGINGAGEARYYGYVVDEASGLRRLATLNVTPLPGGLQARLQASDGSVLLGPVDLQAQVAAPVQVGSCL
jgi:hypothetical protein